MGAQENVFLWLMVWNKLPVIYTVTILLCVIINKCKKNNKIDPIKEFSDKKRFGRTYNIYSKADYIAEIYLFVCITLALIPFVALFDAKHIVFISHVIEKIEVVCNIVIGLTGIVTTMAVVIIVFDKRYYIVFSVKEVLQSYKFSEWLIVTIFSCIMVSCLTISIFNVDEISYFYFFRFVILEIGVIYSIASITYLFFVMVNIMFLNQRKELCLLKQLYRRFWIYKADTSNFKKKEDYSTEEIRINIDYLVDNYTKIGNKKKIARTKRIEFATTIGNYKVKWYGKARDKFIRVVYSLLIISTIINILCGNNRWINYLNIIAAVSMLIVSKLELEGFQLIIIRLYSDTWGYYIDAKKELLVPRSVFIKNVYSKYISSMNNLNAFFYICLHDLKVDQNHVLSMYESVIKRLQNMKIHNMVTYFPLFTIGYFLFEKGKQSDTLRKLYREIIKEEDDRTQFESMMYSQIFYLTGSFNDNIFEYEEKLCVYMNWIES